MGRGATSGKKAFLKNNNVQNSCHSPEERNNVVDISLMPAIIPPSSFAVPAAAHNVGILRNLTHMIHHCSSFMSPAECATWIEFGERQGFELCDQSATREMAHRKQGRISYHSEDSSEVAEKIFRRIRPILAAAGLDTIDSMVATGCLPNIRLYRYSVGDSFGKHIDESTPTVDTSSTSKLTVLIYLNGVSPEGQTGEEEELAAVDHSSSVRLQGGETLFYESHFSNKLVASVVPQCGSLLFHAHGDRCLSHEAAVVTSGVKYVLRTDVVFSPPPSKSGRPLAMMSEDMMKGKKKKKKK